MNKSSSAARQKAVNAAIGSVRAEGLRPSKNTRQRLNDYANGKMTAGKLRKVTIQSMIIDSNKK